MVGKVDRALFCSPVDFLFKGTMTINSSSVILTKKLLMINDLLLFVTDRHLLVYQVIGLFIQTTSFFVLLFFRRSSVKAYRKIFTVLLLHTECS